MAVEASGAGSELVQVVALLAAGVIAVPLFKRLGLGSVLGYLLAGLAIGPFGLGLFTDAHAILHVAELGVVMFLFIIGLEMEPSRLWGMRRAIFGLGLAQVGACIAALTLVGLALGFPVTVAFVAGTGFVLTSTAIVMQLLEERGALSTPKGQRIVAILLLEDLAIVPLLAAVALLAPGGSAASATERAVTVAIALVSVCALVAAGRWLLNPLFRLLAASKAREVMTAAALLVVLGSALAMQLGGLSMAMGAFLAGVAYQIRETVASALLLGEQALLTTGADPEAASAIMEEVRRRDAERLDLQVVGGLYAGRELIHGNKTVSAHGAG